MFFKAGCGMVFGVKIGTAPAPAGALWCYSSWYVILCYFQIKIFAGISDSYETVVVWTFDFS